MFTFSSAQKALSFFTVAVFCAIVITMPQATRAADVWDASTKTTNTISFTTSNKGSAALNFVGDINNDGYDDFIVSQGETDDSATTVNHYLVYGSATRLTDQKIEAAADAIFTSKRGMSGLTRPVGLDINNDNYSDLVIGDTTGTYIIYGQAQKFSGTKKLTTVKDTEIGTDLAAAYHLTATDLNNDGVQDLLINNGNAGSYTVMGDASLSDAVARVEYLRDPFPDAKGSKPIQQTVTMVGDLNNDGFPDWVRILEENSKTEKLQLYYGSATLYDNRPYDNADFTLTADATMSFTKTTAQVAGADEFSVAVAQLQDINRDGYADVLLRVLHYDVKGQNVTQLATVPYILYGQSAEFSGTIALSTLKELTSDFLKERYNTGDLNGDSAVDTASIEIGNSALQDGSNTMSVFLDSVTMTQKTANAMLQFGVTGGSRAANYTAVDLMATPNQGGDLDGDGKSELLFAEDPDNGGKTFLVYGRATFSGAESRIATSEGKSNARVSFRREDGTSATVKPFSNGGSKTPTVGTLYLRKDVLAVRGDGKHIAVVHRNGTRKALKKLASNIQDETEVATFNIGNTNKEEAIVLARSGNTVKIYYYTWNGNTLKQVDMESFQTSKRGLTIDVNSPDKIVTIYDDSTSIASYTVSGTALTVR